MLKMTIDDENVVSNKDITIKEEMLGTSSTILNNVYPEEWEEDKDYVSRFYYPEDYSKLRIQNEVQTQEYEAGTTIQVNGSTTLTDVDTTKNSKVLRLLGQTSQTGTPTPTNPIPVNVVSGDNSIVVCGKNLFDKDNLQNGYINSSGVFVSDTSWKTTNFISVQPNTTYIISNATGRTLMCQYTSESESSFVGTRLDTNTRTITFTTLSNAKYIRISPYNGTGESIDNYQLEKGSSATTYEPYNGNTYPINLGVKNLWNSDDIKSGFLPQSGSYPTTNPSYLNSRYIIIPLYQGQSLTTYSDTGYGSFRMRYIDMENPNIILGTIGLEATSYYTSTTTYQGSWNNGTVTAKKNMLIGLLDFEGTMSTSGSYKITYGTSIQSISPTPIELCKIGTYQDYIYKSEGNWYKYSAIGKATLDGTENWSVSNSGTQNWYYIANIASKLLAMNFTPFAKMFYSNQYVNTEVTNSNSITGFNILSNSTISNIRIRETTEDTTTNFKTRISSDNIIVYGPLQTPTTTQITDTTLIEQLEALTSQ